MKSHDDWHAAALRRHGYAPTIPDDFFDPPPPSGESLAAWFLGPKAENSQVLTDLIRGTLESEFQARTNIYPDDPAWVTTEDKASDAYRDTVDLLTKELGALNTKLDHSVPFYSYRYQAHMLWDITLPSIVGYFAGLLRNQNNVAAEASPVTTWLEMQVGDELCGMLGYSTTDGDAPRAWGHITADGSIANIESMWAARNLKFYPLAVRDALNAEDTLHDARDIRVQTAGDDDEVLRKLDEWDLLNLKTDEILGIPDKMIDAGVDQHAIEVVNRYSVQRIGLGRVAGRLAESGIGPSVAFAPATCHYSWPKAAALLGLGYEQLVAIPVDADGRMRTDILADHLNQCREQRRPVIAVVAVIGTTEESSVDPLAEIVSLRDDQRKNGLDFYVHADAAWGGYFASMLRPAPAPGPTDAFNDQGRLLRVPVETAMNEYVEKQYRALPEADSITVDPHKAGYVPYPAGALCYRNSATRHLVAFTAPIVYHGGTDPTVGVFGVEGSKPGAAAASVYLSHRIIRPDESGYGMILGRCMFNAKRFYLALLAMPHADDPFEVIPFQRRPSERWNRNDPHLEALVNYEGPDDLADRELELFRELAAMSNRVLWEWIHANEANRRYFRQLGSDQTIIAYSFNQRVNDSPNPDPAVANALNQAVYEALSMRNFDPTKPEDAPPLIVTGSQFDPADYGNEFVATYMGRMGLEGDPVPIQFLSTTVMDPFLTDTEEGNLLPLLMEDLRESVLGHIAPPTRG